MLSKAEFLAREGLLTKRLREVAELLAVGKTNKEIAAALVRRDGSGRLSANTVRRCVEDLLLIFGAANRAELANMYGRYGSHQDC